MTDLAVETEGLTKRYGSTTALDGIDLSVGRGDVYGFLGPNGAGKSTAIDMLMDYARPTEGSVRVLGRDPRNDVVAVHQRTGVVPDGFDTYDALTGREHVTMVLETKGGDEDPDDLLDAVGLRSAASEPAASYSRGMEQRLAFAMALAGDPELLLLDEPFSGLDPHGVRTVRQLIRERNENGTTVFFSSHALGEVDLVCDQIGILADGRLVAQGPLERLRSHACLAADATLEDVFVAYTEDGPPTRG